MLGYKQMYHMMFDAATRAEALANEAAGLLRYMQQVCEENFMNAPEEPIVLHVFSDSEDDSE